jgi:arylsulfatase A-like enzyme
VGQVLDALDELNLSQNTLVIWCADHGDAVASHGGLWDKGSIFSEEVARVPLALRWPARLRTPKVVDRLVSNMDVTATMLSGAGIEVPSEMDSRNLLPLGEDDEADWPDHLICEHNGHGQNVLQRIAYKGRCKYIAALYDGDELYDLRDDPYEMNNLVHSTAHRDVAEELRGCIVEGIERRGDRVAEHLAFALRRGF